jgi:hypothetical protein
MGQDLTDEEWEKVRASLERRKIFLQMLKHKSEETFWYAPYKKQVKGPVIAPGEWFDRYGSYPTKN